MIKYGSIAEKMNDFFTFLKNNFNIKLKNKCFTVIILLYVC